MRKVNLSKFEEKYHCKYGKDKAILAVIAQGFKTSNEGGTGGTGVNHPRCLLIGRARGIKVPFS